MMPQHTLEEEEKKGLPRRTRQRRKLCFIVKSTHLMDIAQIRECVLGLQSGVCLNVFVCVSCVFVCLRVCISLFVSSLYGYLCQKVCCVCVFVYYICVCRRFLWEFVCVRPCLCVCVSFYIYIYVCVCVYVF